MEVAPLQRSETWTIILGGLLLTLVQTGVITAESAAVVKTLLVAMLPVLFTTIFRKVRDGKIPFVHA